jgi:hypothetical protein
LQRIRIVADRKERISDTAPKCRENAEARRDLMSGRAAAWRLTSHFE